MIQPRGTDPETSKEGTSRLFRDGTLYERILRYAARAFDAGKPFTDSWLARQTGRPRNVVARMRLECERDGWLRRVGQTKDSSPQLLFQMNESHRALLDMVAHDGVDIDPEENR